MKKSDIMKMYFIKYKFSMKNVIMHVKSVKLLNIQLLNVKSVKC